jgi:hypothetical protein
MKRVVILLTVGLLAAGGAVAQGTANDAGIPATNGPSLGPGSPAPEQMCPPAGVIASAFTGNNTQLGRIFRDGVASVCPGKAYPGGFNPATPYYYETYAYDNTDSGAACVTINFDPNCGANPCATNAHASAYMNSYDPLNQGTNFLGDVGSSVTQPFSFDVPGNTTMVIAVTNTAAQQVCDFCFEVVDLPCVEVPPGGVTVPTLNTVGLLVLLGVLAAAGLAILLRRRRTA